MLTTRPSWLAPSFVLLATYHFLNHVPGTPGSCKCRRWDSKDRRVPRKSTSGPEISHLPTRRDDVECLDLRLLWGRSTCHQPKKNGLRTRLRHPSRSKQHFRRSYLRLEIYLDQRAPQVSFAWHVPTAGSKDEGQPAIHVLTMAFSCELELGGPATLKSLHRKASARKRRDVSMEVKQVH